MDVTETVTEAFQRARPKARRDIVAGRVQHAMRPQTSLCLGGQLLMRN
jgi:hypothetical protein